MKRDIFFIIISFYNVIIGVLDTGVDTDNPDLASKIWTNSDEIPNANQVGVAGLGWGITISYLYNNYDCIIVAAAGNDGINLNNTLMSPVCNDNNENMVPGYGNHSAPLAFDNASPKIQRVTIEHSRSHGVICYNSATPDFGGGARASQGQNKFFNFTGISNKYAFYNDGTADIYARNNYWDTNDSLQIEKLLFDKIDHNGKGRVYFYPFNSASDILAPQVTVVSPNGGENWIIGSKQTNTWSAIDNDGISKVYFSLSRDGGLTFARFDSLFSNPGLLNWTVTGLFSNNCKIKIQAFDFSGNMGFDVSIRQSQRRFDLLLAGEGGG